MRLTRVTGSVYLDEARPCRDVIASVLEEVLEDLMEKILSLFAEIVHRVRNGNAR